MIYIYFVCLGIFLVPYILIEIIEYKAGKGRNNIKTVPMKTPKISLQTDNYSVSNKTNSAKTVNYTESLKLQLLVKLRGNQVALHNMYQAEKIEYPHLPDCGIYKRLLDKWDYER